MANAKNSHQVGLGAVSLERLAGSRSPQLGQGHAHVLPVSPVRGDPNPQWIKMAARACLPKPYFPVL